MVDAVNRRGFLEGGALAVTLALLPDRAQAADAVRGRVGALRERWAQHRQEVRDTLFDDRPAGEGDRPSVAALADGLGALSILKLLEQVPYEDQVHPAMQRLLTEAAAAVGGALRASREVLEAFVDDEHDELDRDAHLRAALRALRLGIRDWNAPGERQRQLELGLEALETDPTPGQLLRRARREVTRLRKVEAIAAAWAERADRSGLAEVHDPAVRARLEAGRARWAAADGEDDPGDGAAPVDGGLMAAGILVLGLGSVVGLVVALAGLCVVACGSAIGVLPFLLGVGIMALSIWGGLRLMKKARSTDSPAETAEADPDGPRRVREAHRVAVLGAEGWVPTPVAREDGAVRLWVRGEGLVRNPRRWLADADGNAVAAGPGGLVPGAPVGALVGRVGDDVFFLGSEGTVPEGPAGPLWLAVNREAGEAPRGHFVALVRVLEPDRA